MKKLIDIERITLHHSLSSFGSARIIRGWHLERGWSDIGYHYVIRTTGTVDRGRSLQFRGAHKLGGNKRSLGLCLVGDFFKEPPTEKQLDSLYSVLYRMRTPGKRLYIDFHRPLGLYNSCPGPLFDRDVFKDKIHKLCPLMEVQNA